MKDENFQPIMDRFLKRCNDWAGRHMSFAAKEVHVKSIVQALPTFAMGVFKFSVGFCDKYERLIREFWWGEDEGQRKVHWMAWDRMIKPKRAGGIGFRDMQIFNQALLARQGWRLLQKPDSLCARVLKSKYYPKGELLDTVFASDASQAWRGIEHGLDLLKNGIIWRVGNGKKIQLQRDQWVPRKSGLKVTAFKRRSRIRWVNQLMIIGSKEWNKPLIHQLFHEYDAEEICKIKIPSSEAEDCIAWHEEKTGIFSVRSAYKLGANLKQQGSLRQSSSANEADNRSIWDFIWKTKVPEKVRILAWRVATKTLSTKENKWKRTLELDNICNICGRETEDEYHAVIQCTKARALREELRKQWDLPMEHQFQFTGVDWLQNLLAKCDTETRKKVLLLI